MIHTDVLPLIEKPTAEYYEQQAQHLYEACRSVDSDTIRQVSKYHPYPEKLTDINKPTTNFVIDDARLVVAREHGFEYWDSMTRHILELADANSPTSLFEKAADALVDGDGTLLSQLVQSYRDLTAMRSDRAHKATLLHYIAANGVENFRQRTPGNIVELTRLLLDAGSDPNAVSQIYGCSWTTTLDLLVSSCHPDQSGVQVALLHMLVDYGAAVNGVRNDGSPLIAAICFHHLEVARALVERGARIDNIAAAAALGMKDELLGYLDTAGKPRRDCPLVKVDWLRLERTPEANLELAFVWAGMFNQTEVLASLLEKGVSPAARDHRQWTALHWAAYYGHMEAFQLLLSQKAPVEARNDFGGTVLDQTLWATSHEELKPSHPEIIWKLLEAGAKIHPWWLFDNLKPPLDNAIAAMLRGYALPG